MKISSKTASLLIFPLLFLAILVLIYLNPMTSFFKSDEPLSVSKDRMAEQESPEDDKQNTIATAWQWEGFQDIDKGKADRTSVAKLESANTNKDYVAFDVVFIYDALQRVKLDDNDNVVLGHDVLTALDEALDDRVLSLDQLGLNQLQDLIKIGLPGRSGEQASRVVGDYFNYLVAKKEFNRIYPEAKNMQEYRSQYDEMLALRNLYLGEDVAQRLFEQEDLDAEHMFATMYTDESTNSDTVPIEVQGDKKDQDGK